MSASEEWLGCGVEGHDDTCLCDVVITEPTPIRVADAVNEMFMGRQICDLRGYGRPWTTETMLDYFSDLCTFYDKWYDINTKRWDKHTAARHRMLQLGLSGMPPTRVVRTVRREYGISYHRSAVVHAVRRFREKQEVDGDNQDAMLIEFYTPKNTDF